MDHGAGSVLRCAWRSSRWPMRLVRECPPDASSSVVFRRLRVGVARESRVGRGPRSRPRTRRGSMRDLPRRRRRDPSPRSRRPLRVRDVVSTSPLEPGVVVRAASHRSGHGTPPSRERRTRPTVAPGGVTSENTSRGIDAHVVSTVAYGPVTSEHRVVTRDMLPDSSTGWSSPVARRSHKPQVGGSNPPPATSE